MESVVTNTDGERRRGQRRPSLKEHGIVAARVKPGKRVTVVNVSAGGALVESGHRLLPGTEVELHMETAHQHATVRGRVVRCHVERVSPTAISYYGAIRFDAYLPWFVAEDERAGYALPASETRPGQPRRAGATPQVL